MNFANIGKNQEIRAKIGGDPFYRFQTVTEIAIAAELGIKIEVNQAIVDDWLRLPGISIRQARMLVELTGNGIQFFSLEDLAAALGVSALRLKPLAPILAFSYYDSDSLLTPQRINANTVTLEQLEQIPLLDAVCARKIVQNRQEKGKYQNLADFQRRLAFDSQLTAQLMHYLQF